MVDGVTSYTLPRKWSATSGSAGSGSSHVTFNSPHLWAEVYNDVAVVVVIVGPEMFE